MIAYIIRRLLYAIPILIGVNLITFALFFVVNTPDDMARMQLGVKHVTPEAIESGSTSTATTSRCSTTPHARRHREGHRHDLLREVGANVRLRFRPRRTTGATSATRSARACGRASRSRCRCFLVGLLANVTFALLMAFFRATYLDFWGVVLCVVLMSISGLFYIIGGQYLVAKLWNLVPISGYRRRHRRLAGS